MLGLVKEVNVGNSSYPKTIQVSGNPELQNIIDLGFWITEVVGCLVKTKLFDTSEINYSDDLPAISLIKPGKYETDVWFRLKKSPVVQEMEKVHNGTVVL